MSSQWPFIIIRHTSALNNYPELFREFLDISVKYPGACDEIWFCAGQSYPSRETLQEKVDLMVPIRDYCRKLGIMPSYQQGVTIGHEQIPSFDSDDPKKFNLKDEDWQQGVDGNIMYGHICPRSANSQLFLRSFATTILKGLKPDSYWLDDDLRMGIAKDDGCFCPRCLEAFNRDNGSSFTREELTARLYSEDTVDDVRKMWVEFNARSIALYAEQLRFAAEEVHPECRLAIQTVWANSIYTGDSYRPLLDALSGPERKLVGIRPGAGFYVEDNPRDMLLKSLSIAREAARCRSYGNVGQICHEEENCPRVNLNKTPEAIAIECALMLASGCDSLSLYWYTAGNPEPLERADHFFRTVSEARPYLQFLGEQSKQTHLGGIARYLGQNALAHRSFDLNDEAEGFMTAYAVPITVEEAEPQLFFLSMKSAECLGEADFPRVFARPLIIAADAWEKLLHDFPKQVKEVLPYAEQAGAVYGQAMAAAALAVIDEQGRVNMEPLPRYGNVPPKNYDSGAVVMRSASGCGVAIVQPFMSKPTEPQRTMLLNAMDKASDMKCPVRLDECISARLLAHVEKDGKTRAATLLNISIGETPVTTLRMRHPAGHTVFLRNLRKADQPLESTYDPERDELIVALPPIPGWQIATVVSGY